MLAVSKILKPPHLKKPSLDPSVSRSLRSFSRLPFLSKVLEKAVATQLIAYMTDNHILEKLQSGFHTLQSRPPWSVLQTICCSWSTLARPLFYSSLTSAQRSIQRTSMLQSAVWSTVSSPVKWRRTRWFLTSLTGLFWSLSSSRCSPLLWRAPGVLLGSFKDFAACF